MREYEKKQERRSGKAVEETGRRDGESRVSWKRNG